MNKVNDNKKSTVTPVLLIELISLVSKCREAYKQERVGHRALALVMAELCAFGRHTITQLLLALGLTEEDWSAWYRLFSHGRYDEEKTSRVMLREILVEVPEDDPFVVGVDGFHVPRTSQKMAGTGWMPGLIQAGYPTGTTLCGRVMADAPGQWLQSGDSDSLFNGLYYPIRSWSGSTTY
jgi:hypothetical protein